MILPQTHPPKEAQAIDIRSHFSLHAMPFTREFPISKHFGHPGFDEAINELHRVINDGMSAALIGPAGTGKSVVLRNLIKMLPDIRYRVTYIHVASLSMRDFCRHLATAIGAKPAGHTGALVDRIQERTAALIESDALRLVIIVDEAHAMRPEVLGLLRLLTNFDVDSKLVLSIILAGQPPLRALLRRDDMSAIRGRLAHVSTLQPLSMEQSKAYLRHRLALAGAITDLFDPHAFDALHEIARGNIRALNLLGLKTLQEAAAKGDTICGTEHVLQARTKVIVV